MKTLFPAAAVRVSVKLFLITSQRSFTAVRQSWRSVLGSGIEEGRWRKEKHRQKDGMWMRTRIQEDSGKTARKSK